MRKPAGPALPRRSIDRRRFLSLLGATGAGLLAGGAAPAGSAPAATRPTPNATTPPPTALKRELESQRKSIADMLTVIRDYELPPGSDLAVTFRPLRARRKDR